MAVGSAARALHREHVGLSTRRRWLTVWVTSVCCLSAACQMQLGSLGGGVLDAPEAGAHASDAGRELDAGRESASVDASVSSDAGVRDAATARVGIDAGSRDAAVDHDDSAPSDASTMVDAAVHRDSATDAGDDSQAWPLDEARGSIAGDAGAELFVGSGVAVIVDGDISEWPRGAWTELGHRVSFVNEAGASGEFDAVCGWQVTGEDLFLAVVVRDDRHDNEHGGFDIWKGDSLQVAFDVGQGRSPYDWEYGAALVSGQTEVHRWLRSDAVLNEQFSAAVTRRGEVTVYELRFTPTHLAIPSFEGVSLRVSVAVNESDGYERTGAVELAPGLVETEKTKAEFVTLTW